MPGLTTDTLLSSSKSDSLTQVQLHPLVILTVSDYVTRHSLRRQKGPIVGAIIGAQNGRNITMEHAFECKLIAKDDGEAVLDTEWFEDRMQQFRDVHKAPPLDLVAWFTLTPPSGPQSHHLALHQQLLESYNESVLLLAFHPTSVSDGSSKGGKLPFTVYETSYETAPDNEDKPMESSDNAQPSLLTRFTEVPYSIETGEAEMISVDFVARGGANATVAREPQKTTVEAKGKGKSKAEDVTTDDTIPDVELLSTEDEELISSLTTKANAIRMLQERVALTKAYLASIPPCYLNTPITDPSEPVQVPSNAHVSHPILRNISSMLGRLPLLTPPTSANTAKGTTASSSILSHEAAVQRSDVALVSLLGSMGGTLRTAVDMGRKSAVMEKGKHQSNPSKGNYGGDPTWNRAYGGGPQIPGFEEDFGDEAYDDGGDDADWDDENERTGGLGPLGMGGNVSLADVEGRGRDGDDDERMT